MRLFTSFFSTANSPGVVVTSSVDDALTAAVQPRMEGFTDDTTPGYESSHAPLSTASPASPSSPVPQAYTPPPLALPMSDIHASGTPVRFSSLMLIVSTQSRKCDHSPDSVSDDQCDKRAPISMKVEPIDDGSHGSNISARPAPLITVYDTKTIEGDGE